jgi:hypothetical protein
VLDWANRSKRLANLSQTGLLPLHAHVRLSINTAARDQHAADAQAPFPATARIYEKVARNK